MTHVNDPTCCVAVLYDVQYVCHVTSLFTIESGNTYNVSCFVSTLVDVV